MRITSKGQVTIPAEIRAAFGFVPETEVEFVVSGDAVILRKVVSEKRRGRAIVERLRGTAKTRMTTEEILALTRR